MSRFEQPEVITAANVSAPKNFRFMLSSPLLRTGQPGILAGGAGTRLAGLGVGVICRAEIETVGRENCRTGGDCFVNDRMRRAATASGIHSAAAVRTG
jgi:hypothetical protein